MYTGSIPVVASLAHGLPVPTLLLISDGAVVGTSGAMPFALATGGIIGILVVILLIVLIIYFLRRA